MNNSAGANSILATLVAPTTYSAPVVPEPFKAYAPAHIEFGNSLQNSHHFFYFVQPSAMAGSNPSHKNSKGGIKLKK